MRFDVIGKPSRQTCVRVEINSEPYLRHGAFAAMNAHYSRGLLSRWTFMLKPNVTTAATNQSTANNRHTFYERSIACKPTAASACSKLFKSGLLHCHRFLEPLIDGDEGTVDFALQAMIPEANVLHAQHYSQEQSVSSLSSSCAAPSYGRCLNRCYSCFREVTITSF